MNLTQTGGGCDLQESFMLVGSLVGLAWWGCWPIALRNPAGNSIVPLLKGSTSAAGFTGKKVAAYSSKSIRQSRISYRRASPIS
jgi:hypothetical protein